jgi:hypothetical protein
MSASLYSAGSEVHDNPLGQLLWLWLVMPSTFTEAHEFEPEYSGRTFDVILHSGIPSFKWQFSKRFAHIQSVSKNMNMLWMLITHT